MANATPILGIDVSAIQGVVDWPRVASAGVKFAWLKCTEGNEPARNDRKFAINAQGCKSVGIYVGAYHFCYPLEKGAGNDPVEQARRAYAASDALGTLPGEIPPACDIEWPEPTQWQKWNVTAETIAAWTKAYLEEATRLWGKKPIVYTYPWFWQALGKADISWAKEYMLWIAHYRDIEKWVPAETTRPIVPKPWDDWTFWQFSANRGLRIPGCETDIDRNLFRGDLDGLRRLAGIEPDAPTQPAPLEEDQPIVHAMPDMLEAWRKRNE